MNKKAKWTEEEDFIIKNFYSKGEKEDILNKLNRSWSAIETRAYKLKVRRETINIKGEEIKIWSKLEEEKLKKYYPEENKDFILKLLPERSWSSIQNKAHLLSIKKNKPYGNLSVLAKEDVGSYYWMGFLIADGHFSKGGSLQINLSKKDFNHINKLACFLNYKKKLTKPSLYINDKKNIDKIKEKFNITHSKTYNPCNLIFIKNKDLFFSLIIGFIDGDGSIKKGGLYIKCHSSWRDNIQLFIDFLCYGEQKKYITKINKQGLAVGWITDLIILKKIKERAIKLNLPILKRKWDNIDLCKKNKKEISQKIKNECLELFKNGLTPKKVIEQTGYSSSVVYKNYNIWHTE